MIKFLSVFLKSVHDFFRDGGVFYSAALSYFTMLTIVPLCLFLITVFGYVLGGHEDFLSFFSDKLVGLFPEITRGITKELRKLITYKGIGKMSIVLYAFLSFQLYAAVHRAMGAVFKVRQERSLLGKVFFSLVVTTLLVCLLIVSFALTSTVSFMKTRSDYFPIAGIGVSYALLIRYVVPLLLVMSSAIMVYMIVPKRKVRFVHACWGGSFTAMMLEAAKHLFTWYVSSVIRMGTIYGSLTTFVVFLLWVFYSSSIFLVGGEITYNLGKKDQPEFYRRRASDI